MTKLKRVYNFSAGPSMLPEEVLKKAAEEMLDYKGTGMSVMEMSHRSKTFMSIAEEAEQKLRKLMSINDNYSVMFLQGGASHQFAMVPANLMTNKRRAEYVHTGTWSKKAMAEAKIVGSVAVAGSSEDKNFTYIPDVLNLSGDADYVHITTNNTIEGTKFPFIPDTGDVPLIADMSSNILSQVYDVNDFGLIYAGAQKNVGPAGVTVVIIRNDLLERDNNIPVIMKYKTHAEEKSLYNTPPAYALYITGLVFDWLLELGGVEEMEKINRRKAGILYGFLDNSDLFSNPVNKNDRSLMNIPFTTGNEALDDKFIKEAEKEGFCTLKGHRLVGGMRASIYNAMPEDGVKKLVDFMKNFEETNRR